MMMLRERMGASLVYFVCEVFFREIIFKCVWMYYIHIYVHSSWWCSASAWARMYMNLSRLGMYIHHNDAWARGNALAAIRMQEVHTCDMTHSFTAWIISPMWHDASTCVTWLVHLFVHSMTDLSVWSDTLICVTWLIHICDMTHSYVWHDPFICATCLNICDMTH